MKNENKKIKSGYVCIVGKTSVGKSSLLNKILGEKISIISNKPQTTRKKNIGIFNDFDSQIIFVDTPGLHLRKNKLSDAMFKIIEREILNSDLILFMIESRLDNIDFDFINKVKKINKTKILVVNKIDKFDEDKINKLIIDLDIKEFNSIIKTSVKQEKNLDLLINKIKENLSYGPKYFDNDILTQTSEREIVCELIREKVLFYLNQEIPHGVFVENNLFKKNIKKIYDLDFDICCERESHKKILIGANGKMIKKISIASRIETEKFLNSRANLKLWVKVKKNWRNKDIYVNKILK
ncbi:MAG: GTPase Era [Clostridiales bacterium]|jgi:GTP-binding protein Era|nr:GTPase Era [Clostridiales bacterium]